MILTILVLHVVTLAVVVALWQVLRRVLALGLRHVPHVPEAVSSPVTRVADMDQPRASDPRHAGQGRALLRDRLHARANAERLRTRGD